MPGGGRRYRPPLGLPETKDRRGRWRGVALSTALHALAGCLLIVVTAMPTVPRVDRRSRGLLTGLRGGGGARAGQERLHWLRPSAPSPQPRRPPVRPPHPTARPLVIQPTLPPPVPPTPAPSVPAPATTNETGSTGAVAQGNGAGGGTGGGQGPAVGPGVGNAVGPGTGGTPGASKFKAQPMEILPPSLGDPPRDRPFHLVATFEVSERGEGHLLSMTQSKDGGFNRRVREDLEMFRFKPAMLPNGTPVKDTVEVVVDY